MNHLKRLLLFILHLGCTLAVQYCLLRLLLWQRSPSAWAYFCMISLALVCCTADFAGSRLLLKSHNLNRYAYIALQFWDVLLVSPIFVLAVLGIVSGGEGTGFGITTFLLDLILILERATIFVLFDPGRKN